MITDMAGKPRIAEDWDEHRIADESASSYQFHKIAAADPNMEYLGYEGTCVFRKYTREGVLDGYVYYTRRNPGV